eukprot:SAG22_NODE_971_length_6228_cov_2.774515_2_plen_636_part_00
MAAFVVPWLANPSPGACAADYSACRIHPFDNNSHRLRALVSSDMCAVDANRAWKAGDYTLNKDRFDYFLPLPNGRTRTTIVATLDECNELCCANVDCAGFSRREFTYTTNLTGYTSKHVCGNGIKCGGQDNACRMKYTNSSSWTTLEDIPKELKDIGTGRKNETMGGGAGNVSTLHTFYRSKSPYSLRAAHSGVLTERLAEKCEAVSEISSTGMLAMCIIMLVGGGGFFVTTYAALGADVTDWRELDVEQTHGWSSTSLATNVALVLSVCWPYVQFASMGFHQTLRWWHPAQHLLSKIAAVADLHIPDVGYDTKYYVKVMLLFGALALFWTQTNSPRLSQVIGFLISVFIVPCMKTLTEPMLSCTYYSEDRPRVCPTAYCNCKDGHECSCFDPSYSDGSSIQCWDNPVHLRLATVGCILLLPIWFNGLSSLMYFNAHTESQPYAPMTKYYTLLLNQTKVFIALVTNATLRFRSYLACLAVMLCCAVDANVVARYQPHVHGRFNQLRLVMACAAGWCGFSGLVAWLIDDPQNPTSIVILATGIVVNVCAAVMGLHFNVGFLNFDISTGPNESASRSAEPAAESLSSDNVVTEAPVDPSELSELAVTVGVDEDNEDDDEGDENDEDSASSNEELKEE